MSSTRTGAKRAFCAPEVPTFRRLIRNLAMLFAIVTAAAAPVLAQDIVLGQSVALSGPAAELGREMQLGAQLYFDSINASGGIRGRKIVLKTLDDGYEPARAEANTRRFIDEGDVLALFGYVGTPTAAASIRMTSVTA